MTSHGSMNGNTNSSSSSNSMLSPTHQQHGGSNTAGNGISNSNSVYNLRSRRADGAMSGDAASAGSSLPAVALNAASSQQQSLLALQELQQRLRNERKGVGLFKSPIYTLRVFSGICADGLLQLARYIISHSTLLYSLTGTIAVSTLALVLPGPHQQYVDTIIGQLSFAGWWVGLGILSSVGLGTGLHTFVLYLGPYIARVTLAATECNTVNISTDGPNALTCPINPASSYQHPVTFIGIMYLILPASFLWGMGTAIGELPPYFVSRAAARSGEKIDDLEEIDGDSTESSSYVNTMKTKIYYYLQRYGFWAILVMASIPNPLFDLAGLTCGHFLVPFATFFGATLIGKAIIKVNIQSSAIVLAFRAETLESIITAMEATIPTLEGKLRPYFEQQRAQFHTDAAHTQQGGDDFNLLSFVWNMLLFCMIGWFVKSIVESKVQEKLQADGDRTIQTFINKHDIQIQPTQKAKHSAQVSPAHSFDNADGDRDRSDSTASNASANGD